MIGYLEGSILKLEQDRILLLVNRVGYEVLCPRNVMARIESKSVGDEIALYIYYQQTERQPKPILIGFDNENEKDFFQHFISVEDIGPLKAVKALDLPIEEIARAIEAKDGGRLQRLKGIGQRTAQKIIAALSGKMKRFAQIYPVEEEPAFTEDDVTKKVTEVLVARLGYKKNEAKQLVTSALKRNEGISTPEELFDEIFRGQESK
jgi:Holliday junction DNA helicase RuvA